MNPRLALTLACLLLPGVVFAQPELQRVLNTALTLDRFFSPDEVRISIDKGVATLSGSVESLRARDRAARITESMRGIHRVVNDIRVRPESTDSEDLRLRTEAALKMDATTSGIPVQVSVQKGIVTLQGQVDTWAERQLLEWVAQGVHGILGLSNQIHLKPAAARPDRDLRRDIETRLRSDSWIERAPLEVVVESGYVRLSGVLPSNAVKNHAELDAWLPGVVGVDARRVLVRQELAGQIGVTQNTPPIPPKDAEILEAIRVASLANPRLKDSGLTFRADQGFMTLSGTVGSIIVKQTAEEEARNTIGVRGVKNNIVVRNREHLKDSELREQLSLLLRITDPELARLLKLEVRESHAVLHGKVRSPYQKWLAWDAAARTRGIRVIENQIQVDPGKPRLGDREIQENIVKLLHWDATLERGQDRVSVSVKNGVARLTGTVGLWSEYLAATQNAFLGGATRVENQLKVEQALQGSDRTFSYSSYPVLYSSNRAGLPGRL